MKLFTANDIYSPKTMIGTISGLIAHGTPSSCWSDDGLRENGHWSATKAEMEKYIGRPLSNEEITCLSISRAYGPTPVLSEEEEKMILSFLWPDGNNTSGYWYNWQELYDKLK